MCGYRTTSSYCHRAAPTDSAATPRRRNTGVWTYSKTFDAPAGSAAAGAEAAAGATLLVLEGVRNGAMVWLNGDFLGNATDQFLRYTYPVALKPSGNVLSLAFGAALRINTAGRYTRSGPPSQTPSRVSVCAVRTLNQVNSPSTHSW